MFKRQEYTFISNPVCSNAVDDLLAEDFQLYEQDSFNLSRAEQKFYRAANYPVNLTVLSRSCWQEPWFILEQGNHNLILNHSMFLCKASYSGRALGQLKRINKDIPQSNLLINTKVKWGIDFSLNAIKNDQVYPVLHIKYDSSDFDLFSNRLLRFEYLIRHTDWVDAANQVWLYKTEWEDLPESEQNHWCVTFLTGWDREEYTKS